MEKKKSLIRSFPRTFWIANLMELFERGAYYGLNAVLAVYLVDVLNFREQSVGFLQGFVYALTGAIVVEVIFTWPGMGSYVTDAILAADFPVIMAVTLIVTVLYVFINLAIDLLQTVIDPRVVLE